MTNKAGLAVQKLSTPHPGNTPAQRKVLDQVGCGESLPSASAKTLAKMVEQGLLERLPDQVLGRDSFGAITVPQYEMPIPVHYQWCKYWSEQPCDEENGA